MHKTFLLCAAATALITASAQADTTVPVGQFHSVTIEGMGHVTFVRGARQRVVLKQGDTTNTQITVKDGDLVFKSCPGKGWFGWNNSCPMGYDLNVEITTPGLAAVEIDGSGKFDTKGGFPQQPKLAIEINGSGNVDLSAMPAGSTDVAIHGSGKVRTTAHDNLDVEIAGSGTVIYDGAPMSARRSWAAASSKARSKRQVHGGAAKVRVATSGPLFLRSKTAACAVAYILICFGHCKRSEATIGGEDVRTG